MIDGERCALRTPSLIALDWGTSSLRATLMGDDGRVLDTRIEPWGILPLPHGDFASTYHAITDAWLGHGVHALAAGMIGSANGWLTAPYCTAPVGADDLAAALTVVPGVSLSIVPGVATRGNRPDVMRGEETQIVGALALHPHLASRSVVVLPGTHSKWVHVVEGKIADFTTYMTGELFAVLRHHSILGRLAITAADDQAADTDAFSRGVLVAQDAAGGLAPLLFSARALVLANRLAASDCMEYLSGLLIGDELRCGLLRDGRPSALVGDEALCDRYASALQLLGVPGVPVIVGAADIGLWHIARRAGLVRTPARAT